MKKIMKKTIKRVAPGLTVQINRLLRMGARLEILEQKIDAVNEGIASHDNRLDRLKELAAKVEPYQPAYSVSGVIDSPRRDSKDRCVTIENAIKPVAGKRILDIGSSLGYVSFYMADRGAKVEGWEYNSANAEVARLIGDINGIDVGFKTKELNSDTVKTIRPGQFDAVSILSVFHHIIFYNGLEYTQNLVKELTERIPIVIVELAKKGEDKKLFWDKWQPDNELAIFDLVKDKVAIKKIGDFGNHLSKHTRPLYMVTTKNLVRVGSRTYGYDHVTSEAYENSPIAHNKTVDRKYYFSEDYIIKEYNLHPGGNQDNLYQMVAEINAFVNVTGRLNVYHAPKLLDFEINDSVARVVVEKIRGDLLSDLASPGLKTGQLRRVAKDVLRTLADLERHGMHHNDVRSWNVIYSEKDGAWLIDYGFAGSESTDDDIIALLWMLKALEDGEREPYQQGKTTSPKHTGFKDEIFRELCKTAENGERSPAKLLELMG
jgi:O-antigen chain-terminating methyltransferase